MPLTHSRAAILNCFTSNLVILQNDKIDEKLVNYLKSNSNADEADQTL